MRVGASFSIRAGEIVGDQALKNLHQVEALEMGLASDAREIGSEPVVERGEQS